jgi:hypothetical protein
MKFSIPGTGHYAENYPLFMANIYVNIEYWLFVTYIFDMYIDLLSARPLKEKYLTRDSHEPFVNASVTDGTQTALFA